MTESNPHPALSLEKGEAEDGANQIKCLRYSSSIHITSPAVGFTRDAGNCGSPLITRSINLACLLAFTRKQTCRAWLMSGNVKVNRHAFSFETKFATTRRVASFSAALPGNSEAVWPSSPS